MMRLRFFGQFDIESRLSEQLVSYKNYIHCSKSLTRESLSRSYRVHSLEFQTFCTSSQYYQGVACSYFFSLIRIFIRVKSLILLTPSNPRGESIREKPTRETAYSQYLASLLRGSICSFKVVCPTRHHLTPNHMIKELIWRRFRRWKRLVHLPDPLILRVPFLSKLFARSRVKSSPNA